MKKLLFLALTLSATVVQAQPVLDYPTRPLRMIVPLAPGGGSDIVARVVGVGLSERWNQHVVIDNRPGAGGSIGNSIVARAPSDAHTLLFTSSTLAIGAVIVPEANASTVKNLAPISQVASQPSVLLVNPSVSAKDLKSFLVMLKSNPKKLNFGSAGVGTASHLANELFLVKTNNQATHVPYKSAGIAAAGLLRNELQFMVTNLATAVPMIRQNRVQALAVTSRTRHASLSDVPTMHEAGVKDFEYTTWYGILAPASVSSGRIEKINRDVVGVVRQDPVKSLLEQQGLTIDGSSAAEFAQLLSSEISKWTETVKAAGIKIQ